jgi:hypothetical protein
MKLMKKTNKTLFSILTKANLSNEQIKIIEDSTKKQTGDSYLKKETQLMINFMKNPEKFKPTDHAMKRAYVNLVVRRYDKGYLPDGRYIIFPTQIKTETIDWDRLKNVEVKLEYGYSSTLGKKGAIICVYADTRKDTASEWERGRSGGVAFTLEDWIEKKSN